MTELTNTARIRKALENAILSGEYQPGERLDPDALARDFSCSRTPIREVLQQLESSGLVQVLPKRGTFVSSWTAAELAERFEVMAEIEAVCARLATRRITETELDEFSLSHADCTAAAKAGNVEAYYQKNSEFHHCLYRAAHNKFLLQEATRLHAMLQPYRRMQLRTRNRMQSSLQEHTVILAAVKAGDAERAATAIHAHVLIQGDRFHDLITALQREETR